MRRNRRSLILTLALVATGGLALHCGDDANLVARQVSEYISNVSTPGGTAQGTLVEGQAPQPNGGPTPTVAAGSTTVAAGGGTSATIGADVPFATILVAVEGASDYYEVTLPAAMPSAEILIGMSDDVPDSSFTFEYAVVGTDGLLGVFVGVPVTVTQGEDGPRCGDGACNGGETTETCSQDCQGQVDPVCGDGACNGGETTETCSQDCQGQVDPVCGDRLCNGGETTETCSQDCPAESGCGEVTFQGECQGNTVTYCDCDDPSNDTLCRETGQLQSLDCSTAITDEDGTGVCTLISESYGYDCAASVGDVCIDWAMGGGVDFCVGTEPGCATDEGGTVCVENVGTCTDDDIGSCAGDRIVFGCEQTQPTLLDCADLGGSCDDDGDEPVCTGLPSGANCDDVLLCGPRLACEEGLCVTAPSGAGEVETTAARITSSSFSWQAFNCPEGKSLLSLGWIWVSGDKQDYVRPRVVDETTVEAERTGDDVEFDLQLTCGTPSVWERVRVDESWPDDFGANQIVNVSCDESHSLTGLGFQANTAPHRLRQREEDHSASTWFPNFGAAGATVDAICASVVTPEIVLSAVASTGPGASECATATCPEGEIAIGGGYEVTRGWGAGIYTNARVGDNQWTACFENPTGDTTIPLTAEAWCVPAD